MVKALFAVAVALGIIALISLMLLYVKICQVWTLEEQLEETRELRPVRIDGDGRWTDWDERE